MDIDVARKTKATPDTCGRCGKTGHWAKECDLRFDVRYMDTDELERVVFESPVLLISVCLKNQTGTD